VRVVIAEDLALLRDGLVRLLRDNDFDVVAAVGDGEALVRAVVEEKPDIAVVDIRLPMPPSCSRIAGAASAIS